MLFYITSMLLGLTAAMVATTTQFFLTLCYSAQRLQIKHLLKTDFHMLTSTLHAFSSRTARCRKENNQQGTKLESILSCHDKHNGFALVTQRAVAELLSMQQPQGVPWQDILASDHHRLLGKQN